MSTPKPAASPNRLKPILLGGVAVAVAENLPGLTLLDWICCGTIWSGALLAVYWRWRQNPEQGVPFREAIALGIGAALLGAVLNLAIDLAFKKPLTDVLRFFSGNTTELSEKLREYFPVEIFQQHPMLLPALFVAMSFVVHATVGAIGGMIGMTLFPPRPEARAED